MTLEALNKIELLEWLREDRPTRIQDLYGWADRVRREHVGDAVHLRGLIEISSYCERQCMYCGLRKGNQSLARYRMMRDEVLDCAREAVTLGYGTVVMQAGEDAALGAEWIAEIVRWIKQNTRLAVTLSLGERAEGELRMWREAGADRYLLRFETSDETLFRAIHPERAGSRPGRLALLKKLKELGFEAGGGVMVGIPGQSYESLAEDVLTFRALNLDMIGIGPYIAHAATPLGAGTLRPAIDAAEQAPSNEEMVYKMIALARLVRPDANIPSTSALATINKVDGRKRGLMVGANVVMPNVTPLKYRKMYEIYPAKACIDETPRDCNGCLRGQIRSLGRFAGSSAGGRGRIEIASDAAAGVVTAAAAQFVQLETQR